jgi:hypothetical protein
MSITPVCRLGVDIHSQRSSQDNEAMRRVTVETSQVSSLTEINGISFLDQSVNVDLCLTCYNTIQQDNTLKIVHSAPLFS